MYLSSLLDPLKGLLRALKIKVIAWVESWCAFHIPRIKVMAVKMVRYATLMGHCRPVAYMARCERTRAPKVRGRQVNV